MSKCVTIIGVLLLFSISVAPAQTPSPDAMSAARQLVETLTSTIADAYTPYFNAMVDAAATVYANDFTVDELREIEALYRRPAGQKLLQKSQAITRQIEQIGHTSEDRP